MLPTISVASDVRALRLPHRAAAVNWWEPPPPMIGAPPPKICRRAAYAIFHDFAINGCLIAK